MSTVTGRTRPTNGTRPRNDNQDNAGGGGGSFIFNLNNQNLPENLDQIGDTPFYNTPPQIEVNECGQVHPSLAYLCDIDLQDPTSFAEPSYEVSINGCGVCVTITQNYSATQIVSTSYCYVLPACRRPTEPEPEPPPIEPGEEYPPPPIIPDTSSPIGLPAGEYAITQYSQCQSVWCYFSMEPANWGAPICTANSNSFTSRYKLKTQGIVSLNSDTETYNTGGDCTGALQRWWIQLVGNFVDIAVQLPGGGYTNYRRISFPSQNGKLFISGTTAFGAHFSELISGQGNLGRCRDFSHMTSGKYRYNFCNHIIQIGDNLYSLNIPTRPQLPSPNPTNMNCCADVRRLVQMVARLEKRIGVAEFPVKVPQSLLADRGNNTIELENIPEQISWLAKQLDALIGEFPGETEVEDIDPQTEGNQTRKFKFPNIAELLLEIVGLAINNKVNTETALTTALNAMVEVGSVKTTTISNHHALQAILDYLSPSLRQSTVDAPLTFTPGETQIHKLLKPSNTKVKIVELDSKTDLQDHLADLKKFAAEWRAQNFRKIKLDGTEAQQIKDLIKNAASLLSDENLAGNNGSGSQGQVSDFSEFIEKAERGFTDANGITDTLNPYGRPYNQRPRVREIGNTSDRGTEES